jgi:hypothetical protein
VQVGGCVQVVAGRAGVVDMEWVLLRAAAAAAAAAGVGSPRQSIAQGLAPHLA